jgi:hypothetical protein
LFIAIQDDPTGGVVKTIAPTLGREAFAYTDDYQKYLDDFKRVKDALFEHYAKTIKVQSLFAQGSFTSSSSPFSDGVMVAYRKPNTSMSALMYEPEGLQVAAYALTARSMLQYDYMASKCEQELKQHLIYLSKINPTSPKTLEMTDGADLFNELRGHAFLHYYERNNPKQITPENKHFSITNRWVETYTKDEDTDSESTLVVDVKFYDWSFSVTSVDGVSPVENAERIVYAWERML